MSVVRVASCRPNPWNRRRPVDPDLRDAEACASYLLLHAAVCGARRIRFDNDAGFVFVHP